MTQRSVLVVTFVQLTRNAGGPALAAVGIAESLHAQGRLAGVVCPGFEEEAIRVPPQLLHSPPHPLLQRIVAILLALGQRIWTLNERRIREALFDFFVSRARVVREAPSILFLKPAFPRTAQRARERQIPTFVWASILHPRFNQEAVLAERAVWEVGGGDAYTDEERITRLSRFFATVDSILVGSELAQRSFVAQGETRKAPILLQGTFSIDGDRFRPSASPAPADPVFRVLHASHMNLIKGIGYLLEAWQQAELEHAELLLAGTLEAELEPIVQRFPSPSINRLGYIRDTPTLYHRAQLFISPSVADIHPYTVLEAMASGLPVLVSDRCGLSTLIEDGVQGFVYPYNDTAALAAHIRWFQAHPEERKAMGQSARERALQCNREAFFQAVVETIDRELA